jgi:hypothetical protein
MIELDLSDPWDADEHEPPLRAWRDPPPWLVPTVLLAVLVMILTTAAPASRRDPAFVQRIPQTGLIFGGDDTAYLVQQRARSGRLQAYRPDRSSPLWTVDYPNANPVPEVTAVPGLVVVAVYSTDPRQSPENLIEGRDSRTGRKLWQRSGLGIVRESGDLLVATDYRGWGGEAGTVAPAVVTALAVRTGETRWSHTVEQTTLLTIASGFAELDQEGVLRELDPASGTVRHTVRFALSGPASYVVIQDGVAVVGQNSPGDDPWESSRGPVVIIGYDLETGEARWRADAGDFAMPCGDRYLCLFGMETLTVTVAKTGAVRYRGNNNRISVRGNLMVASRDSAFLGGAEVWNLATGRKLRSLRAWHIVGTDYGDDRVLVAHITLDEVLTVAMLDVQTGAARVVGHAGDWIGNPDCTLGRRYVGCAGSSGVRIWRIPGS